MKFSVAVQVGNVNVGVDAEGEDAAKLLSKVESCQEEIRSLISLARSLQGETADSRSRITSGGSNTVEDFLGSHVEKLQALSQGDQMLAVLYANFKRDPNSSISPTELAASFGDLGFIRPVNPSDVVTKAARKGFVTLAGGNERGRYRLTVPGRKRAEEILGIQVE